MGVSGGIKALHSVKGLSRGELALIARRWAEAQEVPPIVVVDVSNILYGLDLKKKSSHRKFGRLGCHWINHSPSV